jgi:hypothetical protein
LPPPLDEIKRPFFGRKGGNDWNRIGINIDDDAEVISFVRGRRCCNCSFANTETRNLSSKKCDVHYSRGNENNE